MVVEKDDDRWQNSRLSIIRLCIDILRRYIGSGYPQILLTGLNNRVYLQKDVARAPTQIKELVGGSMRLIPHKSGEYLEAEMAGDGAELVRSALTARHSRDISDVVAGAGFEPATFGL
jgi:hypothetical protein